VKCEDVPISLGLIIENSGSMREKRKKVETAALDLVLLSNKDAEGFVVDFDGNVSGSAAREEYCRRYRRDVGSSGAHQCPWRAPLCATPIPWLRYSPTCSGRGGPCVYHLLVSCSAISGGAGWPHPHLQDCPPWKKLSEAISWLSYRQADRATAGPRVASRILNLHRNFLRHRMGKLGIKRSAHRQSRFPPQHFVSAHQIWWAPCPLRRSRAQRGT
jgi:hypothetical protein